MSKLKNILEMQRDISPPKKVLEELEQNVMGDISSQLPGQNYTRLKVSLVTLTIVILTITFISWPIKVIDKLSSSSGEKMVVESIIIMDNHTAIWLKSIETKKETEL